MKTIIFVLMFLVASTVTGQTNLNLYNSTLNGLNLKDLTIEKITNILGRPSAINKYELIADMFGPKIYYHEKGLSFWFNSKNKDSKQRVFIITVYLSKNWDEENLKWYLPYGGSITPKLNRNMKVNNILPLFKNKKVEVKTGEERRKEGSKSLAGIGVNVNVMQEDIISVQNKGYNVNLFCEEVTKYLEYISITFTEPEP